jgi:GMP synthase-like glutamine amidotransferase
MENNTEKKNHEAFEAFKKNMEGLGYHLDFDEAEAVNAVLRAREEMNAGKTEEGE